MKKLLIKILPLLIILSGVAAFAVMVATREAPERRHVPDAGPLVEAIAAPRQTVQVVVGGQGTVRPSVQIDLVPQVPGIVVWKAPQLEAGGFFALGDLLLRVDPRDYELAITRAEATVARSRYLLELAREEAAVAREEWTLIQDVGDPPQAPGDLVLRLPQVRAAEADLLAALAGLDEARLRLSRTELHAPFTGRVLTANLDAGQYLNANQPVSRIYSIEKAEIVVAVADADLAWFDVPMPLPLPLPANPIDGSRTTSLHTATERSPAATPPPAMPVARISADFAGRAQQWDGRVVRAEAELNARSRMMHLVIEVDRPYATSRTDGTDPKRAPLIVGMFVDVEIFGNEVTAVRAIPRMALREGDTVWVVDAAGILHMRPAQVVRVRDAEALVRIDMNPEELVVVSQLSGATDGMKVRVTKRETNL
jgi:RND family efflux transporter MFP subunit